MKLVDAIKEFVTQREATMRFLSGIAYRLSEEGWLAPTDGSEGYIIAIDNGAVYAVSIESEFGIPAGAVVFQKEEHALEAISKLGYKTVYLVMKQDSIIKDTLTDEYYININRAVIEHVAGMFSMDFDDLPYAPVAEWLRGQGFISDPEYIRLIIERENLKFNLIE